MKRIPISAAAKIAKGYGYDQVVIIARKVGEAPAPHGEWCVTYGVDKINCAVAARIGDFLKYKVLGWERVQDDTPKDFSFGDYSTSTGTPFKIWIQDCVIE
jgi:hypothetical protein